MIRTIPSHPPQPAGRTASPKKQNSSGISGGAVEEREKPSREKKKKKQQLRREDATRNHLHHPDTPGRPAASQPTNATRPPLQCAQASKLVVET